MQRFIKVLTSTSLFLVASQVTAYPTNTVENASESAPTVLSQRQQEEKKAMFNNFAIALYKQNYILPFYYTASPYYSAYINNTPDNERLKRAEVKYQLSFNIPLWTGMFNTPTELHFGYTQLSYWQLYTSYPFFRSTDYEPEFFTQTKINVPLGGSWQLNTIKLGASHQSNGFGDSLERTWNRLYVEASASSEHAMVALRPWVVFHTSSYRKYNPDMTKYLGYGEITLAYKFENKHVLSLQSHGLFERGGRYATGNLTYSFPLTRHINGFAQVFSGYGQSLLEYNHRTNSFGLGFALNNFI